MRIPMALCVLIGMAPTLIPVASDTDSAENCLAEPSRIETARDPRRLGQEADINVSIKQAEFQPIEPIRLDVKVKNTSNHHLPMPSIGYPPALNYRTFKLRVFDKNGDLLPETRFHKIDVRVGGYPVGLSNGSAGVNFNPGEQIRGDVIANLAYDMTSVGEYTILVEFPTGRVREIDGEKVPIVCQSKPIRVKVLPEPIRLPSH